MRGGGERGRGGRGQASWEENEDLHDKVQQVPPKLGHCWMLVANSNSFGLA